MKLKKIEKAIREMVRIGLMNEDCANIYIKKIARLKDDDTYLMLKALDKIAPESSKLLPATYDKVKRHHLIYAYILDPGKATGVHGSVTGQ